MCFVKEIEWCPWEIISDSHQNPFKGGMMKQLKWQLQAGTWFTFRFRFQNYIMTEGTTTNLSPWWRTWPAQGSSPSHRRLTSNSHMWRNPMSPILGRMWNWGEMQFLVDGWVGRVINFIRLYSAFRFSGDPKQLLPPLLFTTTLWGRLIECERSK